MIECGHPNHHIYSFDATLKLSSLETATSLDSIRSHEDITLAKPRSYQSEESDGYSPSKIPHLQLQQEATIDFEDGPSLASSFPSPTTDQALLSVSSHQLLLQGTTLKHTEYDVICAMSGFGICARSGL